MMKQIITEDSRDVIFAVKNGEVWFYIWRYNCIVEWFIVKDEFEGIWKMWSSNKNEENNMPLMRRIRWKWRSSTRNIISCNT